MNNYPTLVVDDDAVMPHRNLTHDDPHTVRIDGDLPTAPRDNPHDAIPHDKQRRPLRVGDKVTLAVGYDVFDGVDVVKHGSRPFATATVAKIERRGADAWGIPTYHYVTVENVEALS